MFTRVASGRRYLCGSVRQATGLCDARYIAAEIAERHVLAHLDVFVGDVAEWLTKQVAVREHEQQQRRAAADQQKHALAGLHRKRERHFDDYRRLVADGDRLARYALEEVERIDAQCDRQSQVVDEAEAVIEEWSGAPDMDQALEFYAKLVDLVRGRVSRAQGTHQVKAELATVIAGI
jgi:hypothetical protein